MTADRLLTVSEAARLLGKSDESVYRMARRGQLAYQRDPVTGSWRFWLGSVDAYLRETSSPRTPTALPARPTVGNPSPRAYRATVPTADEPWAGSIFDRRRAQRKEPAREPVAPRDEMCALGGAAAGHRPDTRRDSERERAHVRAPRPSRPNRGHKEAV